MLLYINSAHPNIFLICRKTYSYYFCIANVVCFKMLQLIMYNKDERKKNFGFVMYREDKKQDKNH